MNEYMTTMELAEKDLHIAERELARSKEKHDSRLYEDKDLEKDIIYWTSRVENINKRIERIKREEDETYER